MAATRLWLRACNRITASFFVLEQSVLSRLGFIYADECAVSTNLSLTGEEGCFNEGNDGILWMAVPKKKTTPSKKKLRNRHKWLKNRTDIDTCAVCGNLKLMNHLCGHCLERVKEETTVYRREHKQDDVVWPIPDILKKFRT